MRATRARCTCCCASADDPFGTRLRQLREAHGVSQAGLAAALHVSPAYLSALEHGHRGRPSPGLIHQVNEYFGLIWDDAEEMVRLARVSHPGWCWTPRG
ncbi:helix-turn-helix domain-containing protein [Paeniroseomonas aquatica]